MYRISKYHIGQKDAENLMKTTTLQRKGLILVTLTNYDNTSAPAIARGSLCEVANTLYESAGEEILGTAVNGQNYIKLIPTSDDNIAAYYTQADPVWNSELGGWYGVGDSANHKYIAGFTFNLSSYTEKFFLYDVESLTNRRYGSGVLNQRVKIITPEAVVDKASISNIISYKPSGYYLVTVQGLNSFTIKKPVTIVLPSYSTGGDYPIYYTDSLEILSAVTWHQCNDPSSSARAIAINPGQYRINKSGSSDLRICGGFGFVQGTLLSEIFTA